MGNFKRNDLKSATSGRWRILGEGDGDDLFLFTVHHTDLSLDGTPGVISEFMVDGNTVHIVGEVERDGLGEGSHLLGLGPVGGKSFSGNRSAGDTFIYSDIAGERAQDSGGHVDIGSDRVRSLAIHNQGRREVSGGDGGNREGRGKERASADFLDGTVDFIESLGEERSECEGSSHASREDMFHDKTRVGSGLEGASGSTHEVEFTGEMNGVIELNAFVHVGGPHSSQLGRNAGEADEAGSVAVEGSDFKVGGVRDVEEIEFQGGDMEDFFDDLHGGRGTTAENVVLDGGTTTFSRFFPLNTHMSESDSLRGDVARHGRSEENGGRSEFLGEGGEGGHLALTHTASHTHTVGNTSVQRKNKRRVSGRTFLDQFVSSHDFILVVTKRFAVGLASLPLPFDSGGVVGGNDRRGRSHQGGGLENSEGSEVTPELTLADSPCDGNDTVQNSTFDNHHVFSEETRLEIGANEGDLTFVVDGTAERKSDLQGGGVVFGIDSNDFNGTGRKLRRNQRSTGTGSKGADESGGGEGDAAHGHEGKGVDVENTFAGRRKRAIEDESHSIIRSEDRTSGVGEDGVGEVEEHMNVHVFFLVVDDFTNADIAGTVDRELIILASGQIDIDSVVTRDTTQGRLNGRAGAGDVFPLLQGIATHANGAGEVETAVDVVDIVELAFGNAFLFIGSTDDRRAGILHSFPDTGTTDLFQLANGTFTTFQGDRFIVFVGMVADSAEDFLASVFKFAPDRSTGLEDAMASDTSDKASRAVTSGHSVDDSEREAIFSRALHGNTGRDTRFPDTLGIASTSDSTVGIALRAGEGDGGARLSVGPFTNGVTPVDTHGGIFFIFPETMCVAETSLHAFLVLTAGDGDGGATRAGRIILQGDTSTVEVLLVFPAIDTADSSSVTSTTLVLGSAQDDSTRVAKSGGAGAGGAGLGAPLAVRHTHTGEIAFFALVLAVLGGMDGGPVFAFAETFGGVDFFPLGSEIAGTSHGAGETVEGDAFTAQGGREDEVFHGVSVFSTTTSIRLNDPFTHVVAACSDGANTALVSVEIVGGHGREDVHGGTETVGVVHSFPNTIETDTGLLTNTASLAGSALEHFFINVFTADKAVFIGTATLRPVDSRPDAAIASTDNHHTITASVSVGTQVRDVGEDAIGRTATVQARAGSSTPRAVRVASTFNRHTAFSTGLGVDARSSSSPFAIFSAHTGTVHIAPNTIGTASTGIIAFAGDTLLGHSHTGGSFTPHGVSSTHTFINKRVHIVMAGGITLNAHGAGTALDSLGFAGIDDLEEIQAFIVRRATTVGVGDVVPEVVTTALLQDEANHAREVEVVADLDDGVVGIHAITVLVVHGEDTAFTESIAIAARFAGQSDVFTVLHIGPFVSALTGTAGEVDFNGTGFGITVTLVALRDVGIDEFAVGSRGEFGGGRTVAGIADIGPLTIDVTIGSLFLSTAGFLDEGVGGSFRETVDGFTSTGVADGGRTGGTALHVVGADRAGLCEAAKDREIVGDGAEAITHTGRTVNFRPETSNRAETRAIAVFRTSGGGGGFSSSLSESVFLATETLGSILIFILTKLTADHGTSTHLAIDDSFFEERSECNGKRSFGNSTLAVVVDRRFPTSGILAALLGTLTTVTLNFRDFADGDTGEFVDLLAETFTFHTVGSEVPFAVQIAVGIDLPQAVHQDTTATHVTVDHSSGAGQGDRETAIGGTGAVALHGIDITPHTRVIAVTSLRLEFIIRTRKRSSDASFGVFVTLVSGTHTAVNTDGIVPTTVVQTETGLGTNLTIDESSIVHHGTLPEHFVSRKSVTLTSTEVDSLPETIEATETSDHVAFRVFRTTGLRLGGVVGLLGPDVLFSTSTLIVHGLFPVTPIATSTSDLAEHTLMNDRFFTIGGKPLDAVDLDSSTLAVHIFDFLPSTIATLTSQLTAVIALLDSGLAVSSGLPAIFSRAIARRNAVPNTLPAAGKTGSIDHGSVVVLGHGEGGSSNHFFGTVTRIPSVGEGGLESFLRGAEIGMVTDGTIHLGLFVHTHLGPFVRLTGIEGGGDQGIGKQLLGGGLSRLDNNVEQVASEGSKVGDAEQVFAVTLHTTEGLHIKLG